MIKESLIQHSYFPKFSLSIEHQQNNILKWWGIRVSTEHQNVSRSIGVQMFNWRSYLIFEAESSGTEETVGTEGSDPLPTREKNK